MSLKKAIEHGKEKRKPYYDSRGFVRSCKNHGSCSYCRSNRLYKRNLAEIAAIQELEDWYRHGRRRFTRPF